MVSARSTRTSRSAPQARLRPPGFLDGSANGQRRRPSATANSGMHLLDIATLDRVFSAARNELGQKVSVSMQDAVLNLCRVKLRDQQRLEEVGYLEEYL